MFKYNIHYDAIVLITTNLPIKFKFERKKRKKERKKLNKLNKGKVYHERKCSI